VGAETKSKGVVLTTIVGGEGLEKPDRGMERDLEVRRLWKLKAGREIAKPSERVEISLEVRVDGTAKRRNPRSDHNDECGSNYVYSSSSRNPNPAQHVSRRMRQ
jgi:hypothetical protein